VDSSLFDFKDYRTYLLDFFGDKGERKGLKSKAAQFMACHTTMVSQILHGQVTPSLEQADKLNQFIGHSAEEAHYFLLLVQKARAGTKSLEDYFQAQMTLALKARQNIKKRVGKVDEIAAEDEQKYYSSWHFAAIHMALTVPEITTTEAIAAALGLPTMQVRAVLEFLSRIGLAHARSRHYSIGAKHIHLGAESPNIKSHHINWRLRAVQSLDAEAKNNFHYSSAVTLSREDVDRIKEILIQNLKAANKIIQASPEEELYALNFDFFNLRI
jgi:uncharacterized protein (TIGR02147 family)